MLIVSGDKNLIVSYGFFVILHISNRSIQFYLILSALGSTWCEHYSRHDFFTDCRLTKCTIFYVGADTISLSHRCERNRRFHTKCLASRHPIKMLILGSTWCERSLTSTTQVPNIFGETLVKFPDALFWSSKLFDDLCLVF
jgi:hypothetical protein